MCVRISVTVVACLALHPPCHQPFEYNARLHIDIPNPPFTAKSLIHYAWPYVRRVSTAPGSVPLRPVALSQLRKRWSDTCVLPS